MRSNAKRFGAVAAGVLALCAAMAPAALAVPEFTGIETKDGTHTHVHTTVKGEIEGTLEFAPSSGFGVISCAASGYEGTLPTGKDKHLTMGITFTSCKDSLGRTVDVAVNACTYTLKAGNKIVKDEYEGTADVVACPVGKKIEFTVTTGGINCVVTVGEQAGMKVLLTDKTDVLPTDVTVDLAAKNVKTTTSGGFFNCGVANGEHSDGEMRGAYTLRGYNKAGTQIDLEVSGE